jgi:phage shock protein A
MADSLRTRVARVIAGGAHALLDKIEDAAPVAMLEQSVREVDEVTDEVRAELGRAVANRHLAQQQHVHLNSEHHQLAAALATALAEKRDDLARSAIARQLDIEAQLPILEASLSQLAQEEKELSGFVDALLGKKREMEKAIRDFEASRERARSAVPGQGAPGNAVAGRLDAAQSAFDRTYQRQTGLDPASRNSSLEQAARIRELNDLVRENKISERLAALKSGG